MQWWPWKFSSLRGDPIKSEVAIPSRSLFAWTKAHRPMVIMVDDDLRDRRSRDPVARYLFELLADEAMRASLYADDGPRWGATEVIDGVTGVRAFRDWAVIRDGPNKRLAVVSWFKDGRPHEHAVVWDQNCFTRIVNADPPQAYVLRGDPKREQLADAKAMLTAWTVQADLYITDRELPLSLEPDPWSRVTAIPPEIALPIVGLYLRRQRRFVLARTPAIGAPERRVSESVQDRHYFYWEAANLLLEEAWRWETACRIHARSTGDNRLQLLQAALLHRMAQVLQSRDRLLAVTSVSQNIDTQADGLDEFEMILVWLMAAFDSVARITHILFRIPGSTRTSGWQKGKWVALLRLKSEALADLVCETSDGWHLMQVLSKLRNYIHGEALSAGGVVLVVGIHALESFMAVPASEREAIFLSLDALGGREASGVAEPHPNYDLHIHPGQFVERLLAYSIRLLNQLMVATPVENLDGIDHPENLRPAPMPRNLINDRQIWQLGLLSLPPTADTARDTLRG